MGTKITAVEAARRLCVILGAGDILDYQAVRDRIPRDAFLICADGGYRHCGILGLTPDLLMGDFDSIEGPLPARIPRITLPVGKDYTDVDFAIREAEELGFTRLLLSGTLGGKRLDHTLGNLQSLARCAARGLEAELTDGITHVLALYAPEGERAVMTLPPREERYFSLFSHSDRCGAVTIRGAVYPLDRYPLGSRDPRAVSNEFRGEPVELTLEDGLLLVVIAPK